MSSRARCSACLARSSCASGLPRDASVLAFAIMAKLSRDKAFSSEVGTGSREENAPEEADAFGAASRLLTFSMSVDLPASDPAVAVSVVVPVRNEAENIVPLIQEITVALDGRWDYEIIYVNDGSTD